MTCRSLLQLSCPLARNKPHSTACESVVSLVGRGGGASPNDERRRTPYSASGTLGLQGTTPSYLTNTLTMYTYTRQLHHK
ncbi:hypothetical protein CGRA01v4_11261 [Colletotrichum graminicola]|nr:hypothetical protein CGRA01v4_11261 [Colletotrichum graminicola]